MTVPLVAATFFGANIDETRRFLHEYGYMPKMITKGRFDHRPHAIDPSFWQGLFALLAEVFKQRNGPEQTYAVDSLPVAACDNILKSVAADFIPQKSTARRFAATSPASGATFLRLARALGAHGSGRAGGVLLGGGL